MPSAEFLNGNFPGKQEDEVILHVMLPHTVYKAWIFFKVAVFLAPFYAALYFLPNLWRGVTAEQRWQAIVFIGIFTVIVFYAVSTWLSSMIGFITDRRIVRFSSWPLGFRSRRALFWKEVPKNKGYPPNILFRLAKVGSIEVRSRSSENDNVTMPGLYYYDDLVNYLDKIVHLVQTDQREKLAAVRPFVLKPKGKRYPMETQAPSASTAKDDSPRSPNIFR